MSAGRGERGARWRASPRAPAHLSLLHPGPPDEPAPTDDLLAFYNLRRLHDFTQAGAPPTDYLAALATDARLWRAADTGLASLASGPPPAVGPGPRPPPDAGTLAAALALEPGAWALPDGARGEPLSAPAEAPATGKKRRRG